MFKGRRENDHPAPSLEELAYWREQELGNEKAALRRRGSGRIRLEPWRGELAKLLGRATLPVPEIRDLLAKMGTEVNVKTLFKFLREEMATEYEAYLEKIGTGRNRKAQPESYQAQLERQSAKEAVKKTNESNGDPGIDKQTLFDAAQPRTFDLK